jgi:hypothetical protein
MKCRKVRSAMALAAGGDLNVKDQGRFEEHLTTCENCRGKYLELKTSLDLAKSLFRQEEGLDWKGKEWQQLLDRVVTKERKTKRPALAAIPWRIWVAGTSSLILLAIAAGLIFLRRTPQPQVLVQSTLPQAEILPESRPVLEPYPEAIIREKPRNHLERVSARMAEVPAPARTIEPTNAAAPQAQSISTIAFVSQQTGLTIYWYVNKGFDYKEEKK